MAKITATDKIVTLLETVPDATYKWIAAQVNKPPKYVGTIAFRYGFSQRKPMSKKTTSTPVKRKK
jgi:hypothetical protein